MAVKQHKELWRTLKFVLFSASAGIIELLSFTLLNELLHLEYWFSYLTALVLSVLWNFTLNRRFTFKSTSNVPVAMLKVFAYYCVFTPVTTISGNYLVETLGWNEYLVTGINMVLNLITEFLFQKYVVYRNSIDTNDLAKKEKEAGENA
ncbi:MAG TPA: GtrA family protein [Clostridia bacterium]|nr:GtrA family protein [Clostridia bacterium]